MSKRSPKKPSSSRSNDSKSLDTKGWVKQFQEAKQLFMSEQYEQVIPVYESLIRESSVYPYNNVRLESMYMKLRAHLQLKDYEEVLKNGELYLEELRESAKHGFLAARLLGLMGDAFAGQFEFKQHCIKYAEAISCLDEYLSVQDDPKVLNFRTHLAIYLARFYRTTGIYSISARLYKECLEKLDQTSLAKEKPVLLAELLECALVNSKNLSETKVLLKSQIPKILAAADMCGEDTILANTLCTLAVCLKRCGLSRRAHDVNLKLSELVSMDAIEKDLSIFGALLHNIQFLMNEFQFLVARDFIQFLLERLVEMNDPEVFYAQLTFLQLSIDLEFGIEDHMECFETVEKTFVKNKLYSAYNHSLLIFISYALDTCDWTLYSTTMKVASTRFDLFCNRNGDPILMAYRSLHALKTGNYADACSYIHDAVSDFALLGDRYHWLEARILALQANFLRRSEKYSHSTSFAKHYIKSPKFVREMWSVQCLVFVDSSPRMFAKFFRMRAWFNQKVGNYKTALMDLKRIKYCKPCLAVPSIRWQVKLDEIRVCWHGWRAKPSLSFWKSFGSDPVRYWESQLLEIPLTENNYKYPQLYLYKLQLLQEIYAFLDDKERLERVLSESAAIQSTYSLAIEAL